MDKFTICSAALLQLDKEPIQSFDDGRKEAEVAGTIYPIVKRTVLSRYTWTFNTTVAELSRELQVPTDGNHQYQFLLPSDYIRLIRFQDESGEPVSADIYQGRAFRDNSRLFARYQRDIDENDIPPYAISLLIVTCKVEFCEPLNGETAAYTRAETERVGKFAAAKFADCMAKGPRTFIGAQAPWINGRN